MTLPKNTIYTKAQTNKVDPACIPRHIAIIPDGNRRWAKQKQMIASEGHRQGADTILNIVKAAKELNVKAITFYTFSTENWGRSQEEVNAFMFLLAQYLLTQKEEMIRHGIRLNTIGDLSRIPSDLTAIISETKNSTAHCLEFDLILALNYGARDELRRAFHSILDDYDQKKIKREEITEELISRRLDTSPWGDPDLLIRAGGELRVSNFLLWQISYAEICVIPVLWPDFSPEILLDAILSFQQRDRRLGGA
jgi:undecaprenyl diphosphate synthase